MNEPLPALQPCGTRWAGQGRISGWLAGFLREEGVDTCGLAGWREKRRPSAGLKSERGATVLEGPEAHRQSAFGSRKGLAPRAGGGRWEGPPSEAGDARSIAIS